MTISEYPILNIVSTASNYRGPGLPPSNLLHGQFSQRTISLENCYPGQFHVAKWANMLSGTFPLGISGSDRGGNIWLGLSCAVFQGNCTGENSEMLFR